MVFVLFSASAFVPPGTRLAVVGACAALGAWNPARAIPLYPQSPIYSRVLPTTFMNWVDIPEISRAGARALDLRAPIAYKFIRLLPRDGSAVAEPVPEEALSASTAALLRPIKDPQPRFTPIKPKFELVRDGEYEWSYDKLTDAASLEWEGQGSEDNRWLVMIKMGRSYEVELEGLEFNSEGRVFLPSADFIEPSGVSECTQTTRYYRTVKAMRAIHFAKVVDCVYVGSCPRQVAHIKMLRDLLKVGCVFNFQAVEDLESNWLTESDPIDLRTPAALAEIYADLGVSLVHLPTVDMSTPARSALMAQSAILLTNYLFANPAKAVYIHCNAGVGRAVAGTLSLLHFVLGMPALEAVAFLKQRRPMAFPDLLALRGGLRDYNAKYEAAAQLLQSAWPQ